MGLDMSPSNVGPANVNFFILVFGLIFVIFINSKRPVSSLEVFCVFYWVIHNG